MAAEPPLTDEQLQLAFRHQRRPHWPTSLQAALAHPIYGPAIRGLARCLSRQPLVRPLPAHHTSVRRLASTVPPTPAQAPARQRLRGKCAAANDRED